MDNESVDKNINEENNISEEINENKLSLLYNQLNQLNMTLTKNNILDLVEIIGNKKKMLIRNLISGISRGIGIGIGVTIITAIIVIVLKNIIKLNIPIIGEFISDIIDIVDKNRY